MEGYRNAPAQEKDLPGLARELREEQEREAEVFNRTMALARNENCPLGDLYDTPRTEGCDDEPEAVELTQLSPVDKFGNPAWIRLSLPERDDSKEKVVPEGVLPSTRESAAPESLPDRKRKPGSKTAPGLLQRLLSGFSARQEKDGEEDSFQARLARERQARGSISPHKPRPMKSLLRMLLVTAVLGALYHLLARQGWVPPLF